MYAHINKLFCVNEILSQLTYTKDAWKYKKNIIKIMYKLSKFCRLNCYIFLWMYLSRTTGLSLRTNAYVTLKNIFHIEKV